MTEQAPPDLNELPPDNNEILWLCRAATGGYRTSDDTGVIRIHGGPGDGETLCVGSEHDVTWRTEADRQFVTRITPYVVHILVKDAEYANRWNRAYSAVLRRHRIDPNEALALLNDPAFR